MRNGNYAPLQPDANGVVKSEVFPGLWLNVPAMLADDVVAVQQTLRQGLDSNEHRQFVAKLAAKIT